MGRLYLLLLVVLSCWGCNSNDEHPTVLRDVWHLEQAHVNSFDPLDAYHACHIQLTKQLFNTLTDVDATGTIVPSLAKSWHSDDGRCWTFDLRDDVLFIDDVCFGSTTERRFVASDVKYTFERLLSRESQSMGVSYFTNILGVADYRNGTCDTISGIKIVNNHTVAFVLNEPTYSFPSLLSLPYCSIVKEKAVKAYNPKEKPIGTGPFQLEAFLADKSISLTRNKDYWERVSGQPIPFVERVEIYLASDDNYSFLLFKNSKVDFIELNSSLLKQAESIKYAFKTETSTCETAQLNFCLFNLNTVDDPAVRKGISYAIDRTRLQKLLGREGEVTHSFYPKVFRNLYEDNSQLHSDGQKAKDLLAGKVFNLKLVTFDDILSRAIATCLKEDLSRYNISVDVESVPFPVLAERLSSGDYDIIQLYWGMLYADPDHFLAPFKATSYPPDGNNFNRYTNAQFEEFVKTALCKDGEEREILYRKAEDVILDDMPFVLLYYKKENLLSDTQFSLPVNPLLYKYYKYAQH